MLSSPIGLGIPGKLEDLAGRQVVNLRTSNEKDSYFGVDLISRQLVCEGYCLRNRNAVSHVLMTWELQGSNDERTWKTLDKRDYTQTGLSKAHKLKEAGASDYFNVAPPPEGEDPKGRAFRIFRVLQTGKNSSGSDNMGLSGLELYGLGVEGQFP